MQKYRKRSNWGGVTWRELKGAEMGDLFSCEQGSLRGHSRDCLLGFLPGLEGYVF